MRGVSELYRELSTWCPVLGAECNYCHQENHFILVCRIRNRNLLRREVEPGVDASNFEKKKADEYEVSFGFRPEGKSTKESFKIK